MSPLTEALQTIDHWLEQSQSWHANWHRITCLMQAIAECAKKFDGISAQHMHDIRRDIYPHQGFHRSILSPIYDKYGVTGDNSGLWR